MESTQSGGALFAPNEVELQVLEFLDLLGHLRQQAAEVQRCLAQGAPLPPAAQLALREKLLRLDLVLAQLEAAAADPA